MDKYTLKDKMILISARGTIGRTIPVTRSIVGWCASDNIARIVPNKIHFGFLAGFLTTIYGQSQLNRQVGGSVVNLLESTHIAKVQIPTPPENIQEKIGKIVIEAYELKELARRIEEEILKTLEDMLLSVKKLEVDTKYLREINAYAESFELIGNEEFQESREELESGHTISFDEFKKEHGL